LYALPCSGTREGFRRDLDVGHLDAWMLAMLVDDCGLFSFPLFLFLSLSLVALFRGIEESDGLS